MGLLKPSGVKPAPLLDILATPLTPAQAESRRILSYAPDPDPIHGINYEWSMKDLQNWSTAEQELRAKNALVPGFEVRRPPKGPITFGGRIWWSAIARLGSIIVLLIGIIAESLIIMRDASARITAVPESAELGLVDEEAASSAERYRFARYATRALRRASEEALSKESSLTRMTGNTNPDTGGREHSYSPSTPSGPTSPTDRRGPLPRVHRTAPSISLSTLNRPTPPPARSPLLSRGVSPVGSNFSNGSDATPLLNAFGLPINKPRTYKVLLPFETVDGELQPTETRKRALWSRRPWSINYDPFKNNEEDSPVQEVRSKSPYPEGNHVPEELPETLEIYLPNDWNTLRQAIFEESMAKIGITTSYLENIKTLLGEKSETAPPSSNAKLQNGNLPRCHLRSESVFAAPFVPRWMSPPFNSGYAAEMSGVPASTLKHKSTMSLVPPSVSSPSMRQQPPFGPRDLPPSRSVSDRLARPALEMITALEKEEEEERVEKITLGSATPVDGALSIPVAIASADLASRLPAKSMTLEELSAGFGINPDVDVEHPVPTASSPRADASVDEMEATSPAKERVAVEGATGHSSLPASASLDGGMEDTKSYLAVVHEPRKSFSAPDLHERLAEQARTLAAANDTEEQNLVDDTQGEESDVESDVGTEYSNPSDEERAKVRRDQGLPSSSLSPVALFRNPDHWLDRAETEEIVSNPSEEETLASRRASWVQAETVPSDFTPQQMEHSADQYAKQITHPRKSNTEQHPILNPDAPPFVFGMQLASHTAKSASLDSNVSPKHFPNSLSRVPKKPYPASSSFDSSQSKFSFARKPKLNVAAAEFKPRPLPKDGNIPVRGVLRSANSQHHHDNPTFSAVSTLGEAKSAVDIWLSDLTSPEEVTEPDQSSGISSLAVGALAIDKVQDNVRTFKFPSSSPSRLTTSSMCGSAIDPPQLPPLGTIGRNTFRNVLNEFAAQAYSEDMTLPKLAVRSTSSRTRSPIPDFALQPIESEPSSPIVPSSLAPSALCSQADFVVDAAEQVPLENTNAPTEAVGQGKSKLEVDNFDETTKLHMLSEERLREQQAQLAKNSCRDDSMPSSIVQDRTGNNEAGETLSQTWRFLEMMLDHKLEGFRRSLAFPQGLASSQPLSPDLSSTLTSTFRQVIREGFPVHREVNKRSSTEDLIESSREIQLLKAIEETQSMINVLDARQERSLGMSDDSLTIDVKAPPVFTEATREAKAPADARQTSNLVLEHLDEALDFQTLSARLAAALQDKIEQISVELKEQYAASVVQPAIRPAEILSSPQHIKQAVRESLADSIPDIIAASMSAWVPLPRSPTIDASDAEAVANHCVHGQTDPDLSASLSALLEALETRLSTHHRETDTKAFDETRSRCELLEAECNRLRDMRVADQEMHLEEVSRLQDVIVNKDKQLELVRDELLKRATIMDQEAKEREQLYNRERKEFQAFRGGLETELAILKGQAEELGAEKLGYRRKVEEAEARSRELEQERQVDGAVYRERDTAHKLYAGACERQQREHSAQMAIMQELLSKEAINRIQLEDRFAAAQAEAVELRQKMQGLETQLVSGDTREGSLSSALQAGQDAMAKAERRSEKQALDFSQYLTAVQETSNRYAQIASDAQHAILALMLSCNGVTNVKPAIETLIFETYFAESEPLDPETNAVGKHRSDPSNQGSERQDSKLVPVVQDSWVIGFDRVR